MAVTSIRASSLPALARRDGTPEPEDAQQQAPRATKDSLQIKKGPNVGDVAKIAGKTGLGAFVGWVGTGIYDLFFHFGNNGGKSYGTGVYAAFAVAGAAVGAWLGIRKFQNEQAAKDTAEQKAGQQQP